MIKVDDFKAFTEEVRKIGDMVPDEYTEGLGEYLCDSRECDVLERVWYALGFLDAVKALGEGEGKEVRYEPSLSAHKALKKLVEAHEV